MNPLAFMAPQWAQGGTNQIGFAMAIAAFMVVLTMFQNFLFKHFGGYLEGCIRKIVSSMDPYVQIKFHEDTFDGGPRNREAYTAIETYLSENCASQAPRLKANAEEYVKYVMEKGRAKVAKNRQLKLYSNSRSEREAYWNYMKDFDHPATFNTLAMEKKQETGNYRGFGEIFDRTRVLSEDRKAVEKRVFAFRSTGDGKIHDDWGHGEFAEL
ncbi:unnamed protein product [Thlaspi arvense]|uniref:AAA-type ATPase N-terminal domain-containing protein n=1 Tax=Thlaspi arvense TaxID=13288 RepID=A0AAU9RRI8_THLAR|nr:unnamed protein product [Thlaspi arvense]